jgi:type IV secretion system protein VirB9
MRRDTLTFAAAWLLAASIGLLIDPVCAQDVADPRLREVFYDPKAVVTVLVKRGTVTDIVLDASEAITDVASGLGADCAKAESSWCVAAQPGGRHLFVKPKSSATAPNNIAVVTDRRAHSFRFVILADHDTRQPVYRLSVRAAPPPLQAPAPALAALPIVDAPMPLSPSEQVRERLGAAPQLVNADYSIAEGKNSQDIVPTLVFDDGRFTYLKFPGNREVPAVFHVLPDGSETIVNTRMEGELLVADRISRRLMLRAGSAAVGVWNESYDLDGLPPGKGTTVPGVDRSLRSVPTPVATLHGGQR